MKQNEKDLLEKGASEQEISDKPNRVGIGLAVFLAVIFIFAGIILVTGVLGSVLGRTAENIALGAVAIILVILLIKSKRS